MEHKLSEFRKRRQREKLWEALTLKSLMEKWKSLPTSPVELEASSLDILVEIKNNSHDSLQNSKDETTTTPLLQRTLSKESFASSNSPANGSVSNVTITRLNIITYVLYTLLWFTCWLIAIQLRFGEVYFVLSAIMGIYLNTRTSAKAPGEMSAYSVFNPNCEAIDGTLKAEQFEREFNLIHHSP